MVLFARINIILLRTQRNPSPIASRSPIKSPMSTTPGALCRMSRPSFSASKWSGSPIKFPSEYSRLSIEFPDQVFREQMVKLSY
ncbi:hypothetical protein M378DRAFT_969962 [Amanita muscaria Koide BX008]|uniref:Uncharacterized protein n=1 Tax=Amanita muscaria (strain Koide BX008) TaxID=946122 RepID=A0A0C2WSJ3_AMAMK|nr:hypothetical protein M378DRAFT_969962 [Amanita muscaria Koide BX008]